MPIRSKRLIIVAVLVAAVAALGTTGLGLTQRTGDLTRLGERLYFDLALSEPTGQACASCHEPTVGFDDPDADLPVSEGVHPGLFGNRNSPISAYAMYAPIFHFDQDEGLWIGGQFWDGRATGTVLGDPLADQALGPFLNPAEMANPDEASVIADIRTSDYADLFRSVWGSDSLDDVDTAYDRVALSIAAFERTERFAPFSSKYDTYLAECLEQGGLPADCAQGIGPEAASAGNTVLTGQEWAGLQLFMGDNDNDGVLTQGEGAFCAACHVADWTNVNDYALPVVVPDWAPEGMVPPVFTDFSFDNLGMPRNEDNPFLDSDPSFIDLGLGGELGDPDENGKFKVMTLRNIDASAPYGHNGLFTTLEEIVHFYNARDVEDLGDPEVPATVNGDELGNLGLSATDEAAVVAFLKTLTDRYQHVFLPMLGNGATGSSN